MKNVLVLGSGQSASFLVARLLEVSSDEDLFVTVGDVDLASAQAAVGGHPKGASTQLDINDAGHRAAEIERSDIVVNMGDDGEGASVTEEDGSVRSLAEALGEADVIVNGILQDTERPLMFIERGQHTALKSGALIVDVSCDDGMGFCFARPTSFDEPTFQVGDLTYYAVDHTPSYLWQSASRELTRVVLPFLATVMGGPKAWDKNETIRRAIEIRDGVVQNERILSFQGRAPCYPHPPISE